MQTKDWLDYVSIISQAIASLATAAALWVTISTLREMKRQTDLANNPFLKIRFNYYSGLTNGLGAPDPNILIEHHDKDPHEQWLQIISRNLDQDISSLKDSYLVLELTNGGRSEITHVKLDVELRVRMFDNKFIPYLQPSNIKTPRSFSVELNEGKKIVLPISNVRYFPIYECFISNVEYRDIRKTRYTDYDGPKSTEEKSNEVLKPIGPLHEPAPPTP